MWPSVEKIRSDFGVPKVAINVLRDMQEYLMRYQELIRAVTLLSSVPTGASYCFTLPLLR